MQPRTAKPRFLTPGEAGAILGLGADGTKAHDDVLEPLRTATGRRLYLRERVEAFASERAARRAARVKP